MKISLPLLTAADWLAEIASSQRTLLNSWRGTVLRALVVVDFSAQAVQTSNAASASILEAIRIVKPHPC